MVRLDCILTPLTNDDLFLTAVVQPRKSGSGQEDGNDNESWEGAHNARRTETFDSMFSNFTTASSKRNAEFHSVFPEAPADEYLIEGASSRLTPYCEE